MNWPDRRLCDLLDIEHPIIGAPMAGASSPDLAGAVANAGGLGSLGCAMMSGDTVREHTAATRQISNRGINLNFFVHAAPDLNQQRIARAKDLLADFYGQHDLELPVDVQPVHFPFDEAMLEVVLELSPRVASFHFGLPSPAIVSRLKDAGILVLSSATSSSEAMVLENAGCDAIIAQGWEAGGHRGSFLPEAGQGEIGTMALVPQVVDAVSVPVIAAGGISDGRGIAAAFALGASGVQIGTAFLASDESVTPQVHKDVLLNASDADPLVTKAFSGKPARGLRNAYTDAMRPHEADLPDFPLMNTLTGPLRKASAAAGKPELVSLWSGQAVKLVRAEPAAAIMARLIDEAERAMGRFSA